MKKKIDFDYIIIGSGPAGVAAALTLAKSPKKKIAIVEGNTLGGTYINSCDVPFDISLKISHAIYEASNSGKFGLLGIGAHFNYPTAINYRDNIVRKLRNDVRTKLKAAGVTCIDGTANFLDATHIAVDEYQYSAKRFIIATGAKLATSSISGVSTIDYLTPATALELKRLPKAVCVIGGGSAGCETAQYFAELGVKTILLELTGRLLPREDEAASKVIEEYFSEKLGMTVLTNARAVAIGRDEISDNVIFSHNNQEKMARVDAIVIATGSEANVDLGLENAGVKYKYSGITVNNRFQTTVKNIFAIGDVIGGESSTDIANYEGTYLATDLTRKVKNLPNYNGFVRLTKTYPQVATVGMNELDLTKRDRRYNEETVFLPVSVSSITQDFDKGFVKILTDKSGQILGATIVAPNAELMIQELATAVRNRENILDIATAPHGFNSYNEVIRVAAKKLVAKIK